MIRKITLLSLICMLSVASVYGQSWRKLSKQADELYANGNYAEAAKLYEQAWQKKNKKKELIYKAGDAYHLLRDYPNAAKAYANVKDDKDNFPLAGLYYARSLKQDGNYEQAVREFRAFLDSYTGEGRDILENIILTEIEGAELGKVAASNMDNQVQLVHLGPAINTMENEFSASMDSDGSMFYSSTIGGTARIFQTERIGESWAKGELPANFPLISNGQFANASMSSDGSRMYFTICEEGRYGDLSTRCEIYFTAKTGGTWSQPVRLPDDINAAGVTSTHPFVTQRNNTEFLFFSSNRSGGNSRGGMDIWYVTRNLRTPNSGFSAPANLGAPVNTNGDEVSPFYDLDNGKLYFASNNHASIGGFDIFVSSGAIANWSQPVNMGVPYNSSADDYHYTVHEGGGFLSSNRILPGEKLSTKDDDVFQIISTVQSSQRYSGTVLDASNGEPINYYSVTLYEIASDNRLIQVDMQSVAQGRDGFSFEVLPNREFRIEIDAPGFLAGNQSFNTFNSTTDIFAQPIMVEPASAQPPVDNNTDPNNTDGTQTPETDPGQNETNNETTPVFNNEPEEEYTSRGTAAYDNAEYRTNAPRYEGTYYKVQIAAVKKFNADERRYQGLVTLGDFETEYLTQKGLYRVLIAAFLSEAEAKQARATARSAGFPNAFVVKYQDGQRYGMVKLR